MDKISVDRVDQRVTKRSLFKSRNNDRIKNENKTKASDIGVKANIHKMSHAVPGKAGKKNNIFVGEPSLNIIIGGQRFEILTFNHFFDLSPVRHFN